MPAQHIGNFPMDVTDLNPQVVRYITEQYPHGVPTRLLKAAAVDRDATSSGASIVFSGPSASKLAVVFFEDRPDLPAARDLVVKAITSGLKRSIAEVLLVQCSIGTGSFGTTKVSLADCSPKCVLIAGGEASLVSDVAAAEVMTTDSIQSVLVDPEAKKRFWHALQKAWECSQS